MQTFGLTLLVLWIAVSNLALGFALAMALGHGPQLRLWRTLPVLPPLGGLRLPKLRLPALSIPTLKIPKLGRDSQSPTASDTPASTANATVDAGASEPTPENSGAETTETPDQFVPLDDALREFQEEVAAVRDELNDLDQRAQACSESPAVEMLEECVADLKQVSHRMLEQQARSRETLKQTASHADHAGEAVREMDEIISKRASELQHSLDEIEDWKINPDDLNGDCERLQQETSAITATCRAIDETIDEARSSVATQAENDEGKAAAPAQLDDMTIPSALDRWWNGDPEHQRPLALSIVDIDEVQAWNDLLGRDETNSLLQEVEKLLLNLDVPDAQLARLNPQRFLVLMPSLSLDKCTRLIEALRESITQIELPPDAGEREFTASCALVTGQSDDTTHALIARAEAALAEAKQFGGNRTFLNEGAFPTPVIGSAQAVAH